MAESDLAEPLTIIEVDNQTRAIKDIAKTCSQEKIQEIVLGLPSGSDRVKKFGQALSDATGLKVIFWDETLTSEEALAKMIQAGRGRKKRRRLDAVSAALILQEYLDSK